MRDHIIGSSSSRSRSRSRRKTRRRSSLPLSFLLTILTFTCLLESASARLVGGRGRRKLVEKLDDPEIDPSGASSSFYVSTTIPSLSDTTELAHLSSLVYYFRSAKAQDCSSFPLLYREYIDKHHPPTLINTNATTYHCHMYERNEQDTQVLILSRDYDDQIQISGDEKDANANDANFKYAHGYVAVIYAGTDDFRTALTDANLLTAPFGPEVDGKHPLAPSDDVRVHAGFNNQVFLHGLFDRVKDTVLEAKRLNPHYRIYTSGHSLGAANADLTAVAMKMQPELKDELICGINFGSPKTGNYAWRDYVNSIEGLGIWRVVNGYDLVPRLPGIRFHHVGHTVQLDRRLARAFWLHEGDESLGYRGVPFGWNSFSYALAPGAAVQHMIGHYTKYLDEKSAQDENTYYVDGFEKCGGYDEDDDEDPDNDYSPDDDIWDNIPDDDILSQDAIIEQCAEQYLALVKMEEDGVDVESFGMDGLLASSSDESLQTS